MHQKSIDEILREFFPKSDIKDWEKIATLETKKDRPSHSLSWRGADEILFLPYYNEEQAARRDLFATFPSLLPEDDGRAYSAGWLNLPSVSVHDEKTANAKALNDLSLGADGLLFRLHHPAQTDLAQLMAGLQWPESFIAFQPAADLSFPDSLSRFIKANFDPGSVKGALFWESIPKESNWKFCLEECKELKSLGLVIPPASPTEEICHALIEGVKTVEALGRHFEPELVFQSICFSFSASPAFLESVSTFRAIRRLWFQVAHAYGQNYYKPSDLHLHARSSAVEDKTFGPHENMLKGAFSAIAAVAGGCHALTIDPAEENSLLSRCAVNISNILREESFFDRVGDAVAGAYAVECMTADVAAKAWAMFQEKCERL